MMQKLWIEGQSPEQAQSQEQTQSKGNCAEKPRVVAPKENQMGIIKKNCKGFNTSFQVVRSNAEQKQMALIKQKRENKNLATKYKNNNEKIKKQDIENKNAKIKLNIGPAAITIILAQTDLLIKAFSSSEASFSPSIIQYPPSGSIRSEYFVSFFCTENIAGPIPIENSVTVI